METKTIFPFAIKSSHVIEIITIFVVIVFGYVIMSYLQTLDIVDDVTEGLIANLSAQLVIVVSVIVFAIILAVLFLVLGVLRKKP